MNTNNLSLETKKFLENVSIRGLESALEEGETLPEYMKYPNSGYDIGVATLAYFANNEKSLDHFSKCLSAAYSVGIKTTELNNFVDTMNKGYISGINQLDKQDYSIQKIAEELLFWDGCALQEVKIYFEALCNDFIKKLVLESETPDSAYIILESAPHSDLMSELQLEIRESLRKKLIGSLVLKAEPKQRLRLLIKYASGKRSAAIVDEELWNTVSDQICSQCKTSINIYIQVRNILLIETQKQEDKANLPLLQKLNAMIVILDSDVNWGIIFNDPKTMLNYWRTKRFEGVFEGALLEMYRDLINKNPTAAEEIFKIDYQTLKNKGQNKELVELLKNGTINITRQNQQNINPNSKQNKKNNNRRSDGFGARNSGDKSKPKKINYIYLIYAIVATFIVAFIGTLTINHLKTVPPKPAITSKPVESSTPKITKKTEQESTPKPTPRPTSTPTSKPTSTPSPTLEITPEPDMIDDEQLEPEPQNIDIDPNANIDEPNIVEPDITEPDITEKPIG